MAEVSATQSGIGPCGRWTLAPLAAGERALIRQMLQYYLYDFSEMAHDDLTDDGTFAYEHLDRYLDGAAAGYHALMLRIGGKPAGFTLVDEHSPLPDGAGFHYVHEFHVIRAYRGAGYGQAMAWATFDRFPGKWQIEEIAPNRGAQAFWRRAIDRYTGGRYRERVAQRRRFHVVIQEFDTADRVLR